MKSIRLKEEYKGLIITRQALKINGTVTFDTNVVLPCHWKNFYNIGFQDLFEEIEVKKKARG